MEFSLGTIAKTPQNFFDFLPTPHQNKTKFFLKTQKSKKQSQTPTTPLYNFNIVLTIVLADYLLFSCIFALLLIP